MSVHDEKGKIELAAKMRRFEEPSNVAAELYTKNEEWREKNGEAAEKLKKKWVAAAAGRGGPRAREGRRWK